MVMVYAGGQFSGGHYNPAVNLAELVRRRITLRDALAYCIWSRRSSAASPLESPSWP
jgi:aquaporin Z